MEIIVFILQSSQLSEQVPAHANYLVHHHHHQQAAFPLRLHSFRRMGMMINRVTATMGRGKEGLEH